MSSRILIVDDDPTVRMLVKTVLSDDGHEVLQAAAGEAARDLHADLVLVDVGLGFDTLTELVATGAPVLIVTAWAAPELIAKAHELGARGHVQKPFDCVDLRDRVAGALPAPLVLADAA